MTRTDRIRGRRAGAVSECDLVAILGDTDEAGAAQVQRLVEMLDRPAVVVPCGRPSSGFQPRGGYSWDPADDSEDFADGIDALNLYRAAVREIHAALVAHPSSRLVAVSWRRNEDDLCDMGEKAYEAKLAEVERGLRHQFGDEFRFLTV